MNITRRDFLVSILGMVPAVSLPSPKATALNPHKPPECLVGEPADIRLDGDTLSGPYLHLDGLMTNRDWFDYEWMTVDEKIAWLLEHHDLDEASLAADHGIDKPDKGWDDDSLARVERELGGVLDEIIDEAIRPAPHEHDLGIYVYTLERLPQAEQVRLGLHRFEGTGTDRFTPYMRFTGDIDRLNAALARHGINAVVRYETA